MLLRSRKNETVKQSEAAAWTRIPPRAEAYLSRLTFLLCLSPRADNHKQRTQRHTERDNDRRKRERWSERVQKRNSLTRAVHTPKDACGVQGRVRGVSDMLRRRRRRNEAPCSPVVFARIPCWFGGERRASLAERRCVWHKFSFFLEENSLTRQKFPLRVHLRLLLKKNGIDFYYLIKIKFLTMSTLRATNYVPFQTEHLISCSSDRRLPNLRCEDMFSKRWSY